MHAAQDSKEGRAIRRTSAKKTHRQLRQRRQQPRSDHEDRRRGSHLHLSREPHDDDSLLVLPGDHGLESALSLADPRQPLVRQEVRVTGCQWQQQQQSRLTSSGRQPSRLHVGRRDARDGYRNESDFLLWLFHSEDLHSADA